MGLELPGDQFCGKNAGISTAQADEVATGWPVLSKSTVRI